MVASLSVLSSLSSLSLGFEFSRSRRTRQTQSPPKRSIFPALKRLHFSGKGVAGYLEELVTRIDAPQLNSTYITFYNQIDFDCPQLSQFVNRTPTLRKLDEARVQFEDSTARIELRNRISRSRPDHLNVVISSIYRERGPDWQLSSIKQVCSSSFHPLSTVVDLYIENRYWKLVWRIDSIENTLWLELLLPFTKVKNLYLSKIFAPGIAAALEGLTGDRITEILPSLRNIFVEGLEPSGPFETKIEQFVTARQHSGHPIAISVWEKDPNMESM